MKIMFINSDGGGFADFIDVAPGTTISQLFQSRMQPDAAPNQYLIRVNRQETSRDYTLQENDRVSITPLKIDGGC